MHTHMSSPFCSSIHAHFDCFHLLALVNDAAVDFSAQISTWIPTFNYFGHIRRHKGEFLRWSEITVQRALLNVKNSILWWDYTRTLR